MKNPQSKEELASKERAYWTKLNTALERLMENDDFKTLILDGYIKDLGMRQVSLLADEGMKAQGMRPNIMEQLVAISNLQYFLEVDVPNMAGSSLFDQIEKINKGAK